MAKKIQKVNLTSSNLSEEKLQELRRILPEAFSESRIDWDRLKTVLGDHIDPRIEKFGFSWAGKNAAVQSVLIPSTATLRPSIKESVKFDNSENLFIEGDNLEVLKLLQKAYFEKVKVIYIDPPYNTGSDFIYKDNFTAPIKGYLEQTGQVDGDGQKLQTNRETNGRYHSDWLSMMYPRLKLGWNLLQEDGVMFVSIDDHEVHHLRMLMDEVFGEENFVAELVWNTKNVARGVPTANMIIKNHEYVLVYGRNANKVRFGGNVRNTEDFDNPDNDPRGVWRSESMKATGSQDNYFDIVDPKTGNKYGANWAFSQATIKKMVEEGLILFPKKTDGTPRQKKFLSTYRNETTPIVSNLGTYLTEASTKQFISLFDDKRIFDFPKPVDLIKFLIQQVTKDNDIVFDFFAGSATTAHAVLLQNQEDGGKRKFILVQLPEVIDVSTDAYKAGYRTIADVSKDRIRRVLKGYGKEPKPIEDGFKAFILGESNYPENNFDFDPDKNEQENKKAFEEYLAKAKQTSLFDAEDGIDVVYENIVKEGLSLNARVVEQKLGKNKVYVIADGERSLLVCLDKKVEPETIKELTGREYKDRVFICIDKALDDTGKANLGLNLELKTL